MIRIRRDDFEDRQALARYAAVAGVSVEEFRAQFEYLIDDEPPSLELLRPTAPDRESAESDTRA